MTTTEPGTEDVQVPWHLRGNWAPMHEERTETELVVEGTIPPELNGVYIRTGPNPASGTSAHWFFGDGMVHGIRLSEGRAEWYRNRMIQTERITGEKPKRTGGGGTMDFLRGTGNTHVLPHNGEILCLEEGHWPWRIDTELNTLGVQNYGGALTTSMTAHPKICPVTGELLAFSYMSYEPPFLNYIRVSPQGSLLQLEPIEIPNMVMMHDFNVTRNHVVFMDLPLCFDLSVVHTGLPFQFKKEEGARLGVMPRNGTNADVRWFEIEPCYVFHPVNAFEETGPNGEERIVLHVARKDSAYGSGGDDYSDDGSFLWKWTIDLTAGTVTEEQIDDRNADFGRVDERLVGLDARFGYMMALGDDDGTEPVYGSSLFKYDLRSGAFEEHSLGGNHVHGAEPVFAPRAIDAGEDDGWIMNLVHDEATGVSSFVIIDAQNFSAPPVASIQLPQRVPYGAHGSWISD